MTPKRTLVTGGTGFIGAALVRRLVRDGHRVRVLDNDSRGSASRLDDIADDFEKISGDVRDAGTVEKAARGMGSVCHLAFVNGTEFFYKKPELVLDVGVKGMVNVLDACIKAEVGELVLASSSEVYQQAPRVPTDETVPLSIPDPTNPRYSYAAGKIISEIMALNYGRKHFERVLIFRPHNVYGPDMGWEHVLPQFVLRMKQLNQQSEKLIEFPIQGTGKETRAFVFIDDFVDGLAIMLERGEHLGIYNIGSTEEVAITNVAALVGEFYGRRVKVVAGSLAEGGTPRRCPDIGKLAALGYRPRVTLSQGLPVLARWYDANADKAPAGVS